MDLFGRSNLLYNYTNTINQNFINKINNNIDNLTEKVDQLEIQITQIRKEIKYLIIANFSILSYFIIFSYNSI
jgi:hypothetical protein